MLQRQPFSHERHVHPPRQQSHEKFVEEAKAAKMTGLGGHRSVGGCRASIYNAVSLADCEKLAQFMKKFQQENE